MSEIQKAAASVTVFGDGKRSKSPLYGKAMINPDIKKDCDKVVDFVCCPDIEDKLVMCRCWRSAKFPYCDGAHVKHNEATGDNVGPLIIKKDK